MSLILDALRKSDVERSRQQAPQVAGTAAATPERPRRAWVAPVVVLLALNAVLLAWLLLRPSAGSDGADAGPGTPEPTAADRPAPAADPVRAVPSAETTVLVAPAPQRPKAVVRSLADESRVTTPVEAPADMAADAAETPAPEADAEVPAAAPDGGENPTPRTVPGAPADARALVDRGVVPADALAIELHVFGSDPARRFAFIGGRKVVAGDTLAAGIGVVEIVRNGVVIEHRGTRYLLRRD